MASLRDIRKRIKSVKNTRQITKAMKMVSAAKLRRAQEAVISSRPFAQTIDAVMGQIIARAEPGALSHPLLTTRPTKKVEIIVITSDRGLAGGFNANINRRALKYATDAKTDVVVSTVGRKGNDFLRGRGLTIRKDWPGSLQKVKYATAEAIAQEASKRFLDGEVDAVFLMFNEFASAVSQVPTTTQLLPFEAPKQPAGDASVATSLVDFEYEPDAQSVLNKLVPQAVSVKVYRSLLESVAAEHAARMTAMENATKNAGEMIGSLTLFYNRSRQALITKELMEIVSGAEALK
jgi:F-type H+-transporting ATPase subunit gamma